MTTLSEPNFAAVFWTSTVIRAVTHDPTQQRRRIVPGTGVEKEQVADGRLREHKGFPSDHR